MESARRLFEVVDAPPEVKEASADFRYSKFESRISNIDLRVEGLGFAYPHSPQPALEDLSIFLPAGGRIALVGTSGAGKTSLANLLLRFWEYSEGKVLLGGRELRSLNPAQVREMFSVVPQAPFFFNASILENLLLARPCATQAEVEEAARRACIHEFVSGLPDGYRTVMGERGLRLSSGERQRLAVARALLKEAPILLLDEPTANLDPQAERLVLESLLKAGPRRSVLLITHRLIRLEAMDEILVLEAGRIVERGRHSELVKRGGLYCRQWEAQERILEE
jgi:ABC-type multidrug transport system fused ATPase/permease subunit